MKPDCEPHDTFLESYCSLENPLKKRATKTLALAHYHPGSQLRRVRQDEGVMLLVLLLAASSEGHVRLNYIDGSDLAIRNANSATGNGRASVAGGLLW